MNELETLLKMLGIRIRELRVKKGFSITELAEETSVTEEFVAQLENGELDCDIVTLVALADALGVKLKDLFQFTGGDSMG